MDFASPTAAADHFAARLSFETDVSDVHADLEAARPGLVVVDIRSDAAWSQGTCPVRCICPAPTSKRARRG